MKYKKGASSALRVARSLFIGKSEVGHLSIVNSVDPFYWFSKKSYLCLVLFLARSLGVKEGEDGWIET